MIVWDTGPYRNLSDVPLGEALDGGRGSFWLEGRKLRGGKPQWLLVKRRDEEADARRRPVSTQPESVLSGKTIEEITADG